MTNISGEYLEALSDNAFAVQLLSAGLLSFTIYFMSIEYVQFLTSGSILEYYDNFKDINNIRDSLMALL